MVDSHSAMKIRSIKTRKIYYNIYILFFFIFFFFIFFFYAQRKIYYNIYIFLNFVYYNNVLNLPHFWEFILNVELF